MRITTVGLDADDTLWHNETLFRLTHARFIDLLDDPKVTAKRIRSAVTDTEREIRFDRDAKPGVSNLLTILAAVSGRTVAQVEAGYAGAGYGDLKVDVANAVVEFVTPFQERTHALLADAGVLDDILADGARRARVIAQDTLARVYDRVGLLPRSIGA